MSPSIDIPKIESDLNQLKGEASTIVKEAQENAEIIRGLIPEATATSLSVAIDDRAKQLMQRVRIWLIGVISVLIFSSYFSWNFLQLNGENKIDSEIRQNSGQKLVLSIRLMQIHYHSLAMNNLMIMKVSLKIRNLAHCLLD